MTIHPDEPALRSVVVEDHLISRRYITEALRRCGWAVKHCRSAEEALPVCRHWNPRLVITDLHLPGADGCELAEQLSQHAGSEAQKTVMLLVSAQTSPALERRASAAGFAGIFCKPMDFNRLQQLLPGLLATAEKPARENRQLAVPETENVMHPNEDLISLFYSELEARLSEMEAFLLCGRITEAGSVAHQLTASAAICGKQALESCLREFNAACRQPIDAPRLARTFTRFHRCARNVLDCPAPPGSS